jgi:hypothetical protein
MKILLLLALIGMGLVVTSCPVSNEQLLDCIEEVQLQHEGNEELIKELILECKQELGQ